MTIEVDSSLADDDDGFCAHVYNMEYISPTVIVGGLIGAMSISTPPYRHCYPIDHFSVIIVKCELVDMYYLRRHFEFYLVVSKDYCF